MIENLWSFRYHKGPASLDGIVRASSDVKALEVATVWCRQNNCRPPASVRPMVLADETILGVPLPAPAAPLPGPVAATTGVESGKGRK